MMITSEQVKQCAREWGADLVGIANIERFAGAPPETDPLNIYPETRSVIVIACRILEGSYKGIEQGTDWAAYWIYGYGAGTIGTLGRASGGVSRLLSSYGHEAVHTGGGATMLEQPARRLPVAPGKVASDVSVHTRIAAALAGLGEPGWSKVFLTPQFGPRQRFHIILTDAELEPDPLMRESICDRCMSCVRECPGYALGGKEVSITVEGRTFSWGDVDLGKCKVTHWGINPLASPFVRKDLPGLNMDVKNTHFGWYEAYRLGYAISTRVDYQGRMATGFKEVGQSGRPGPICGARGCIQACYRHLKKKGAVQV
jgi:epoxyqueuosine reductase